ncbi:MAG: hypothetical protein ACI841_000467 [Planctomycetota bacterium]|jgi:hypothetical protein
MLAARPKRPIHVSGPPNRLAALPELTNSVQRCADPGALPANPENPIHEPVFLGRAARLGTVRDEPSNLILKRVNPSWKAWRASSITAFAVKWLPAERHALAGDSQVMTRGLPHQCALLR